MSTGKTKVMCAVFWYRREEWDKWREISDDRAKMHDSFDEWEASASHAVAEINRGGIEARKVEGGIEEFLKWIDGKGLKTNGQSRSQFANEKLQKQMEPPAPADPEASKT